MILESQISCVMIVHCSCSFKLPFVYSFRVVKGSWVLLPLFQHVSCISFFPSQTFVTLTKFIEKDINIYCKWMHFQDIWWWELMKLIWCVFLHFSMNLVEVREVWVRPVLMGVSSKVLWTLNNMPHQQFCWLGSVIMRRDEGEFHGTREEFHPHETQPAQLPSSQSW